MLTLLMEKKMRLVKENSNIVFIDMETVFISIAEKNLE